jgi:HAMP domain-containing protein
VYAVLFLLSFFLIFSVLYWLVTEYLQNMHGRFVLTKKNEIENLLAKASTTLDQVESYMRHEAVAAGTEHIFLCLWDKDGKMLACSDATVWQMLLNKTPCVVRLVNKTPSFAHRPIATTLTRNSKRAPVTISYFPQSNGCVLQIAVSRKEDRQFLAHLIKLLGVAYLFVLATALFLGFLMVKHILRPMYAITKTAREISLKNLQQRVPVTGMGDELDQLATTLNEMLARIEKFTFYRILW